MSRERHERRRRVDRFPRVSGDEPFFMVGVLSER